MRCPKPTSAVSRRPPAGFVDEPSAGVVLVRVVADVVPQAASAESGPGGGELTRPLLRPGRDQGRLINLSQATITGMVHR